MLLCSTFLTRLVSLQGNGDGIRRWQGSMTRSASRILRAHERCLLGVLSVRIRHSSFWGFVVRGIRSFYETCEVVYSKERDSRRKFSG